MQLILEDLTNCRRYNLTVTSKCHQRLFGGGHNPTNSDVIDYVTIASTGNAVDFGNLLGPKSGMVQTSCASSPRGIFGPGGDTPGYLNVIQFVTIPTLGNAETLVI